MQSGSAFSVCPPDFSIMNYELNRYNYGVTSWKEQGVWRILSYNYPITIL